MENAEHNESHHVTCVDPQGQIISSPPKYEFKGHNYPAINISGNAQVQLGDQHFLAGQPAEIEQLSSSLYFAEIQRRYENIEDAHSKTFQWIFEPPQGQQPPWDSFVDWLKNEQPIYWISGKPGSGKSTLMKSLVDNMPNATCDEPSHSLALSFWFWEAGQELERGLIGCVRSLLWQLLRDERSKDAAIQAVRPFANATWTRRRLKDCLQTALKSFSDLKLYVFLDGLDEAGNEAEEIFDLFEALPQEISGLKICISSRPEQLFVDAFSGYPRLRAQDLNAADIDVIIADDLFNNPKLLKITKGAAQLSYEELRYTIKDKAEGVMLWVKLVIRSLLTGIRNRDDIETLQRRLEELPSDLDALYEYMLRRHNSNIKHYAQTASFYCKLILHREMYLPEFCLAINGSLRKRYLEPETNWDMTTVNTDVDCEQVITWINVRTGGLLEVVDYPSSLQSRMTHHRSSRSESQCPPLTQFLDAYSRCSVTFIHRTARTYLLDTASGCRLLSSCMKVSGELEQICFESCLVFRGIFLNLELEFIGSTGMQAAILPDPCQCKPSSGPAKFQRVCNTLLKRPNCLLDTFWMPGMGYMYMLDPFPSWGDGKIDFCKLYCMSGCWWDEVLRILDALDGPKMVETLSILLVFVIYSLERRDTDEESVQDVCLRLIEQGADPTITILSPNNEEIWLLPYVTWQTWTPRLSSKVIDTISEYSFDRVLKSMPVMSSCSEIVWDDLSFRERTLQLWGDFSLSDAERMVNGSQTRSTETTAHASNRIYVICDLQKSASGPVLFPMSFPDSQEIIRRLKPVHIGYRTAFDDTLRVTVGMVKIGSSLKDDYQDVLSYIEEVKCRSTPFRSLLEAFQFMGKSPESIQKWASAEETKLRRTGDSENNISRWKAWVFGTHTASDKKGGEEDIVRETESSYHKRKASVSLSRRTIKQGRT